MASVARWTQRARATDGAATKTMGGKCPFLLEAERNWLLARLDDRPDLTNPRCATRRWRKAEGRLEEDWIAAQMLRSSRMRCLL
jgi:hypothetical protein